MSTVKFNSNMTMAIEAIMKTTKRDVARATEYTRNQLVKKVNNKGDGHTYIVPNTGVNGNQVRLWKPHMGPPELLGRVHIASSPGDPPAVLFGHLKGSFQTRYNFEDGQMLGFVGPVGVDYAKPLEFGHVWDTEDGPKWVAPRPYMRPIAIEEDDAIERILRGGPTPG